MSELIERLAALPIESLALLNLRLRITAVARTDDASASEINAQAAPSLIRQADRGRETDVLDKLELSDAQVEDLLRHELSEFGGLDTTTRRSTPPSEPHRIGLEAVRSADDAELLERIDQLSDEQVDALLRTMVDAKSSDR